MPTNAQDQQHASFNQSLEVAARKLFDSDAFVNDALNVFYSYREIYADAKKYDLIAVRKTKKNVKAIVKLTKKMLDLRNETVMLVADAKPRFDHFFQEMTEFKTFAAHLNSTVTSELENSALMFCDVAEHAARSLPKNVAHAISLARQKGLLIPLHMVFRKHGLNQVSYFKSKFGNPSLFIKFAVSGAQAAGDWEANPPALKRLL